MTAADRPPVTDNARAWCPGCGDRIPTEVIRERGVCSNCWGTTDDPWAAGRAETTTATDEDAEAAVVDALGQSPFAHHEVIPSGETASTLYITHDDEWADLASLIVQMLTSRGLLATAHTRPTEAETRTTTEWGVRGYRNSDRTVFFSGEDSARYEARTHGGAVIRQQVTTWPEGE